MHSPLVLSILGTHNENLFHHHQYHVQLFLNVCIISKQYIIAGFTTLQTFFSLAAIRLSQITPDSCLHPLCPAFTLFFTSLVHCLLPSMADPRYFNSSTFTTSDRLRKKIKSTHLESQNSKLRGAFVIVNTEDLPTKCKLWLGFGKKKVKLGFKKTFLNACPVLEKELLIVTETTRIIW